MKTRDGGKPARAERRLRRYLIVLGALCLVSSVAAACGSTPKSGSPGSGSTPPGTVRIAFVDALTGVAASPVADQLRGAEGAVSLINKEGGILGKRLVMDSVDTAGDPADAVPALEQEIGAHHPIALVGFDSASTPALQPVADRADIPMLIRVGLASVALEHDKNVFRFEPSDFDYGPSVALGAYKLGYRKVAVLVFNSDPDNLWAPLLEQDFQKLGGTVVKSVLYTSGQTSYDSEVESIIASKPQAVIVDAISPTDMVNIVNTFRTLDNLAIPLIGTDAAQGFTPQIGAKIAHGAFHDVVPSSGISAASTAALNQFNSTEKTMFGKLSSYGGGEWDAIVDLGLALTEDGGNTSAAAIDAALLAVNNDESAQQVGTYAEGVRLLKEHKKIDYEGVGGDLDFDPATHLVHTPWSIVEPETNGSFTTVGTISEAAVARLSEGG